MRSLLVKTPGPGWDAETLGDKGGEGRSGARERTGTERGGRSARVRQNLKTRNNKELHI